MTQVRVNVTDAACENCGYPFDRGDTAYDVTNEYGVLVCSKKCGEQLIDSELRGEIPVRHPLA